MNEVATPEEFRLSPLQQGMFFHHLSDAASGIDIEQVVATLDEPIEEAAFAEAWRTIVQRHAVLRTTFRWEGLEEPVQHVHAAGPLPLAFEDWRDRSADEQAAEFERRLDEDRRRGYDLTRLPLSRVALFRTGEASYRLLWSFHHILLDGRSFVIVLRDVFALYEALAGGGAPQLPPAPRPYRDFVDWLNRRETGDDEAFWRAAVAGFRTPTPLVVDRPAAAPGDRGERSAALDARTTQRLRGFAETHGLTLNSLLQGAWAILLHRYSGEPDIVYGVIRAGRSGTIEGADTMVGLFINTLPVRVRIADDARVLSVLGDVRAFWRSMRPHEQTPLVRIQQFSDVQAGTPMFESLVNFQDPPWNAALRSLGGPWERRAFEIRNKLTFPLLVDGYGGPELAITLKYDRSRFADDAIDRMLGHLMTLLEVLPDSADLRVGELPLLTPPERITLLETWNATAAPVPDGETVHGLIAAQAARSPGATALVFEDRAVSFAELERAADGLAHRLAALGVGRGSLVGVCLQRSIDLVVGLLGVLKAGAAYVPLDPEYPPDRIAFMIEDAGLAALVTQERLRDGLPPTTAPVVSIDDGSDAAPAAAGTPLPDVRPDDLAYVIYTSGSTGRPKGVMLTHDNVVNFFVGMDERLDGGRPGVWLAVTSVSFDISVLELFWTLARGFKVVIQGEHAAEGGGGAGVASRPLEFSLFYFASYASSEGANRYAMLLDGARFADEHGFTAVWTPERHFHDFGGLYPSPAVAGGAIAAITKNVGVRAGSVVLPLNDPIRVAEEWSVVDNLSGGRVGLSVASGWHDQDFVFAPDRFADRKRIMFEGIDTVRRLWRGEAVRRVNGTGKEIEVRILPRPVQPELPVWVTAAGSPETFEMAGQVGGNLLTHLLGQTLDSLAAKIRAYRDAWRAAGHPGEGHVTLMLHTYVGTDDDEVREVVREPFSNYLRQSVDLMKNLTSARAQEVREQGFTTDDLDAVVAAAFERYFKTSGLMGTVETCLATVERLGAIGVDEVACLIDFGVPRDRVLDGLVHLAELKERSRGRAAAPADFGIAGQILRHGVTHLQCTPSMARMLLADPAARRALGSVQTLMLGGEALPPALLEELRPLVGGTIHNMYGPTETTIWSATHRVHPDAGGIVLGRPIANTTLYVLDRGHRPVPVGVPGELYIGGRGVAAGYLNRPELTAERFIPSPFDPADRLYATGDVVRYRADGLLEFLGRTDHQVKIRGHRIELGEIEAVLDRHAAVRQAVVLARGDADDPRLVAYVVADSGIGPAQLRDHMAADLPAAMLPSTFVMLDALPLTPNGKVDRRALPEPQLERATLEAAFVPPRTPIEQELAAIWQEVLRLDRVGANDNFFDLGGSSLSAVRVAFKVREAFQLEFSLASFFRAPVLSALAGTIEAALLEAAESDDELRAVLSEVERLSDEEARALLHAAAGAADAGRGGA